MKLGRIAAAFIVSLLVAAIAWNAGAQAPADEGETEAAQQDLRDANAVCRKHRAELMKIPHVRVVTTEVDAHKDAVILVEVDDSEKVDEVTRKLPSRIEGYPVEVEAAGPEDDPFSEAGHWGIPSANPTRFPTIDKNGYYHHTWLQPATPAASR